MARFLGVTGSALSSKAGVANSGAPECDFGARLGNGRRVRLSVEVDTEPQAYAVMERAAEEDAQIFGPHRFDTAPQDITGLGIDAQWFPAQQQLMTTNGLSLITATVTWPSVRQSRRRALAAVAARPYLGRIRLKDAKPIGP